MLKSKQKRLIASGWKVGSTTEFLGLSPDEESYIELKLRLSDGLKRIRESKHLTQIELAKLLHSSQSRVAKMEAGDRTVSLDLLIKAILRLGTTTVDLAQLIGDDRGKAA